MAQIWFKHFNDDRIASLEARVAELEAMSRPPPMKPPKRIALEVERGPISLNRIEAEDSHVAAVLAGAISRGDVDECDKIIREVEMARRLNGVGIPVKVDTERVRKAFGYPPVSKDDVITVYNPSATSTSELWRAPCDVFINDYIGYNDHGEALIAVESGKKGELIRCATHHVNKDNRESIHERVVATIKRAMTMHNSFRLEDGTMVAAFAGKTDGVIKPQRFIGHQATLGQSERFLVTHSDNDPWADGQPISIGANEDDDPQPLIVEKP